MSTAEPPPAAELPVHLSRFVGRDRELDDIARLVGEVRLLTLTGAGGSGKTRLASEAAARAATAFDRVTWVDLAPLTDPDLLAQQVAAAMHAPERNGISALRMLVETIGDTETLLVLDNCEHLVDACAALVDALLRACPCLTVLATSREALGVASETAWLVPPLASAEAVRLFVDRAQAALPAFALTATNGATLGEICRRLDGIPLAIELAAARVRVLSPEQIVARLDDAFRLLSSGSRTALPRHRTLRATMEWSFALLTAREQVLLQRLAAFAGSFTLDAAEAVCAGAQLDVEDILDGVAALVDKSLVMMEPGDGEARYRLLETVRQYGVERLTEAGDRESLERRHADFFLHRIEAVAPELVGGATTAGTIEALALEHDNMRAASFWAVSDAVRSETALRFAGALFWYWYSVGQIREARHLVDRALALDASAVDPVFRGRALVSAGLITISQGEQATGARLLAEAVAILRARGDTDTAAVAEAFRGAAQLLGGDVDGSIVTLDAVYALRPAAPPNDMAMVFARFWRAWAADVRGEHALGLEIVRENVAVARRFHLRVTHAHSLAMLARIELARDNVEEACRHAADSLERELALGDGWGIGLALDVAAAVAARRGRQDDAVRLIAGTEAHRERLAIALPGLAPIERVALVASFRETLGDAYDRLRAEGHALSTAETAALAFAEIARHTAELRVPTASVADAAATIASEASRATAPAVDGARRLRVLALGPLQVHVGDRLIGSAAWGSARPRELLVYLLMHPDGRTKEQVGLAFWPDASAAQLRNSFHVTLHRLRKALGGADWVTLSGDRYRVDPTLVEAFDVHELEREVAAARRLVTRQQEGAAAALEQALAGYRGELLDGEPVGDWHLEHRDRLQRLYVDALMSLGARHAAEERPEKAAEAYRRVLARDELHEDALHALMRCHAAAGERSQALRLYRRFADRLRAELEAEPRDATTRLFERLQQGAGA